MFKKPIFIVSFFLTWVIWGCSDANKEVFENYKSHKKAIYQLSDYFSKISPMDYGLEYHIFKYPRTNREIDEITAACNYKKIDNNVLVKYGGPAFGSDCFPDKR